MEAETALLTAQEDERHATWRALHDPAMGLPNRVLFDDRVTQGISLAEWHGWSRAVMFLDLLVNPKSTTDVERKAIAVLGDIAQAIEVGGRGPVIRGGIAPYPGDGTTADQLVRNADTAMYHAKNGACRYVLFGSAGGGAGT